MTSDYNTCREKKGDFYARGVYRAQAQNDYAELWPFPRRLCSCVLILNIRESRRFEAEASPSITWTEGQFFFQMMFIWTVPKLALAKVIIYKHKNNIPKTKLI
jgi:hypothetical protein